ncbi:hypothetical protein Gpo141_00013694 [Globisporangium polare]
MVCSTTSFLKSVALTVALVAARVSSERMGCVDGSATPAPASSSSPAPAAASGSFVNWYVAAEASDYNNQVHADFFQQIQSVRAKGERYAVFDWDNTCMYGDISYTSVYYQMDNLVYRIKPEKFEEAFSLGYSSSNGDECLPLGINSVLGKDVNGTDVTLATALKETAKDYKFLYESYIAPANNLTANSTATRMTLAQVKETTEFKNFRAKISFLTYGIEAMDGGNEYLTCTMRNDMTVFPQLLVGMTEAEVRAMIRASIRWNLGAKLDSPAYFSTGSLAVEGDYTTGLRAFNGQETAMRSLRAYGTDVHIISASPQIFAEEAGNLLGLGYMVPSTNVWGVRFTTENGTFSGKALSNYPITWGPGKATIVNDYLKPKYNGKAPVYSSGDSNGDCEMLDTVRDGVVHVNNRLKDNSTCIQAFYELSCKYFMSTEPSTKNKYLLQGQDKALGSWIPSGFSTKDGVSYKSNAVANNGCAAYKFLQQ